MLKYSSLVEDCSDHHESQLLKCPSILFPVLLSICMIKESVSYSTTNFKLTIVRKRWSLVAWKQDAIC